MAETTNNPIWKGDNFGSPKITTKYLNYTGLADFWSRVKIYIDEQDASRNGQNIPLYPIGTESNKSITTAIEDLSNSMQSYSAGTGLNLDETTFNLKTASATELGGIKSCKNNAYTVAADTSSITSVVTRTGTGYCGVELDSNDKAFVYVPIASTSKNGLIRVAKVNTGTQTTYTNGTVAYGLEVDVNGKGYVKIPQIPTYGAATENALGLIKVGDGLSIANDTGVLSVDSAPKLKAITYSVTNQGKLSPSDLPDTSMVCKMMSSGNDNYTYTKSTTDGGYWDCMFMNCFEDTNVKTVTGIGILKKNNTSAWLLSGTRGDETGKWNVRKLIDETGGSFCGNLTPSDTNTYNLGSSTLKWSNVYATTFNGNATSATNASNIYINTSSTSAYYPMTFVTSTRAGNKKLYIDSSTTATTSSGTGIRYNPSAKTCYCSGGFYELSDEKLKNFGDDIEVDLDKLSKLSKKYFTWKDDESNTQHIGVSAQEVQTIYPEIVNVIDEEGHLSVSYDKLSVVALKGIDVLNDKIKSLEERLERLEKIING